MEKSNDLKEFAAEMFRLKEQSRYSPSITFVSGSISELPLEYVASNLTDLDIMRIKAMFIVISNTEPIPNDKIDILRGDIVVIIESDGVPQGFTRLRIDQLSMALPSDSSVSIKNKHYLTHRGMMHADREFIGPAQTSLVINIPICSPLDDFHNTNNTPLQATNGPKFSVDFVHCSMCKSWPNEASEWMHRSRRGPWPSPDLIETIINGGCHLVAKSHPSYTSDTTMFRFSFSVAETLLIQSLTPLQKYIYHILRLIKAEVIKRLDNAEYKTELCTYHFKTLMMWSCEERPSEFWSETHIATSVGELLCQMIEWLIDKNCPNYFIRKNNMMGPFSSDLTKEIDLLLDIRNRICLNSNLVFQPNDRGKIYIPISRDLLTLILTMLTVATISDAPLFVKGHPQKTNDPDIGLPSLAEELIHEEFLDLYRSISAHRQLVISDLDKQNHANIPGCPRLFSTPKELETLEYFKRSTAKSLKCDDVSLALSDLIGENLYGMLWK